MDWIIVLVVVLVIAYFVTMYQKKVKCEKEWDERHRPLTAEEELQVQNNISLLCREIPLNEFLELEKRIKVNNRTDDYNKYGCFVIYNHTKNLFAFECGAHAFPISIRLWMFFVTNEGCGNPYMHMDYMAGDNLSVRFIPLEGSGCNDLMELDKKVEREYKARGESYFDFISRVGRPNK